MLAGLNGGDAAESVIALATGALNPPAGVACEEKGGWILRASSNPSLPPHPHLSRSVS